MFYLYAARAARGLGDGFAAIILPTYLSEFGFRVYRCLNRLGATVRTSVIALIRAVTILGQSKGNKLSRGRVS